MNLYGQIEIGVRKNVIKPLVSGVFTIALLALPPQAAERSQGSDLRTTRSYHASTSFSTTARLTTSP